MNSLNHIFENNSNWAQIISEEDPDFFKELSKGQAPEILWIGCSDSRVPPNQIMGLSPGDVFVHRNIANVVVHTDLNSLSVIQYAVEVLKVKHVIVCGHYGCGGIKAAIDDQNHGLIDNWLRHIKDVSRFNADSLKALSEEEQISKLCELNVIEQVKNVCGTTIIHDAWKQGQALTVHGWIYALSNGMLKNLDVSISSPGEFESLMASENEQ
ncbi:MAG: carbonate dehydratase [Balneolaceae bacterium]|nr:carbonate dehydratase [Balneolaceae bacterium]